MTIQAKHKNIEVSTQPIFSTHRDHSLMQSATYQNRVICLGRRKLYVSADEQHPRILKRKAYPAFADTKKCVLFLFLIEDCYPPSPYQ